MNLGDYVKRNTAFLLVTILSVAFLISLSYNLNNKEKVIISPVVPTSTIIKVFITVTPVASPTAIASPSALPSTTISSPPKMLHGMYRTPTKADPPISVEQ